MKTSPILVMVLALVVSLALAGCESKTYVHREVDAEYVVEEPAGESSPVRRHEASRTVDTRGDKTKIHEESETEIVLEEDTSVW